MSVYVLANVRREERRLAHLLGNLAGHDVPPAVVVLIRAARMELTEAAQQLDARMGPR